VFGLVWVFVTALVGTMLNQPSPFADPYDSLIGACAGAGAIAIAGWLGEVALKKEAMGFGDVTLMAVIGAAVGPGRALLVVFVGALIGVVDSSRSFIRFRGCGGRIGRQRLDLALGRCPGRLAARPRLECSLRPPRSQLCFGDMTSSAGIPAD
jgi:hypothetical protein